MSGALGVAGGLEARPHWAPIQGHNTPTGKGVGASGGVRGPVGGVGVSGVHRAAGRECRDSRGQQRVRGCQETLGASRGVGTRGSIRGPAGGVMAHWVMSGGLEA